MKPPAGLQSLMEVGLIDGVVRMLCAGVVQGDLSEFNILLGHTPGIDGHAGLDGPVIIDLPQAVLREIDDARAEDAARRLRMQTAV